jgi:hypothetical protein
MPLSRANVAQVCGVKCERFERESRRCPVEQHPTRTQLRSQHHISADD